MKVDRRRFLKVGAGGTFVAAAGVKWLPLARAARRAPAPAEDAVVRSTCSPNCTGACGMLARVSQGRIVTLQPAADYPEPEYNPRGCLRGLSMTNLIYGKDRLRHPMIRTGKRGSGRFRRASWDEALDLVADKLRALSVRYGPESIAATIQVPGTGYVQKGALVALAGLCKWTMHHGYDQNGDLPMFWPMTFGVQSEELEALEWRNAAYTMVFGSNVMQTRLPDAQHLLEAKRKGKLVVIDPDYCSTAAKADEWVSIRPDTDAALALGMAKVILDRDLHDAAFLRRFTDLPLLVRVDDGKRLLAGEVKALAGRARATKVPEWRRLFVVREGGALNLVDPEHLAPSQAELDAGFEVELVGGQQVRVETVLRRLRRSLEVYTPSEVERITEVPAAQVVRLAEELAARRPAHLVYGASNYQWYHGDLKGRAISLLAVLTGNLGRPGAGISTLAGQYRIRLDVSSWWFPEGARINWVPYLYFLRGEGPGYPEHGIRAMIGGWGNPFDQHNLADRLKEKARSGELELIVTMDFQMTTSAAWSDVVLPVPSWYEKVDLTATVLHPYLQLQQPAIEPLYESRSELWIARQLARRLMPERASHFLPELDEAQAAWKVVERLLENGGPETRGITLADLRKGPVRLRSPAPGDRQIPFWEQIQEGRPFPPPSHPAPLPATAKFVKSGRIELYKDEDAFLAAGEALPVHKESFVETEYRADPGAQGKYPLRFVTKNSLYRVHSTHSNNPWLIELQDFRPKVFLNAEDAGRRGIAQGDLVQVFNGRGKTRGHAIFDPGCRAGTVIFEQGWWGRYLADESFNSLIWPWVKPLHEVYFVPGMWSPTTCWNECLVDVRKVSA